MTQQKLLQVFYWTQFSNKLCDPHLCHSWSWRTTSNPDFAIATEDVEVTSRSVCQLFGGRDHKPIMLTMKGSKNKYERDLLPSWNYKKLNFTGTVQESEGTACHSEVP